MTTWAVLGLAVMLVSGVTVLRADAFIAGQNLPISPATVAVGTTFSASLVIVYAASIQCPLGAKTGCFYTSDLAADMDVDTFINLPTDGSYRLLPGVLHAYRVSAADLGNYVEPSKHP